MKEKWKCQGSRFTSVLIKMTYPFSFNFTNTYICIILGRKEHNKEYEPLGYHRSGFKFRFCYKSHCVTLKVYHTPSISASIFWAMTWWYQVKWLQSLCSSKLHALCSVPSTFISMQMKCGWTEAFHMCLGKVLLNTVTIWVKIRKSKTFHSRQNICS